MTSKYSNKPVYILGYSGLDNSLEFKQNEFPTFTPEEIRISQGMDSAAALIKDGKIVAATEEERFTYKKHSNKFPIHAIRYCLEKEGISIGDVNHITHGFDYGYCEKFYRHDDFNEKRFEKVYSSSVQKDLLRKNFMLKNLDIVFVPVKHHDAHAASAFYPSGFETALVVIVDGMGEMYSTSIYQTKRDRLIPLKQDGLLSSLGMFYSMLTYHLGFSINSDEYKVMGLAPYGNHKRFLPIMRETIEFKERGEVFIPLLLQNKDFIEKESYRGVIDWLSENVIPKRKPNENITQDHKDLAATLQFLLNKAMLHIVKYWQKETGEKNLCMAGGVALNCVANGEILRNNLFEDIFIQPAAGDDGTAVGSALYQYYAMKPRTERVKENIPFYGYMPSRNEIITTIEKYKDKITFELFPQDELFKVVADLLDKGKVIALIQGEMEFGPRALGHRSIIADPRSSVMKDLINSMVKKRESFRPFAPSVISEKAQEYFELHNSASLPYMIFTVQVKKKYQSIFPAITHIDGSVRIQTVDRHNNRYYWNLIKAFEEKSGHPIVLNTSFNINGQPIVRTVEDAMSTFLTTGIHALVINNYLIFPKTRVEES